jgi:hypothetical protein
MRCARGPRRPLEEPEVVTDLAGSDRQDVRAQHGEVAAVADLEFTRHTLYAADVNRVDALAIDGERIGET